MAGLGSYHSTYPAMGEIGVDTKIWALHVLTDEGPFLTMHNDNCFDEYATLQRYLPVKMAGTMITRELDGFHYAKCFIIPTDVREITDPAVSVLVVEAKLDYVEIEDEADKPDLGNPFHLDDAPLSVLEDTRLIPLVPAEHGPHCLHQN